MGAALALALSACSSSSKGASTATTGGTGATSGTTGATSGTTGSAGSSGGSLTSSDVGVSPTTIKIGIISSLTGVSSSNFADSPAGALARIDAQNAAGGVDGRKIELVSVDDNSTVQGDLTASQAMAKEKGVFGVIDYSAFTYGGYRALQQAGIPVTGYSFDGPEWGVQPDSNMFSYLPPVSTAWNGQYYYPNYVGKFLQSIGAKKPAGFAYGVSPSSIASIKVIFKGASQTGLSACYPNYTTPFGAVDFTAQVLQIKSLGCDAVIGSFVDASDVAMATALSQAGLGNVKKLWYTGYDTLTLKSPASRAAFEGSYFSSPVLFDRSIPGVGTMLDNFAKYDSTFHAGDLPDFGAWGSYIAADLMIKGLQLAGTNPTRKAFISNLRQVTNYNAGGILATPTSFTNFGTPQMMPTTACQYYVQLKNGQFVNAAPNGKSVCAGLVVFPAK